MKMSTVIELDHNDITNALKKASDGKNIVAKCYLDGAPEDRVDIRQVICGIIFDESGIRNACLEHAKTLHPSKAGMVSHCELNFSNKDLSARVVFQDK